MDPPEAWRDALLRRFIAVSVWRKHRFLRGFCDRNAGKDSLKMAYGNVKLSPRERYFARFSSHTSEQNQKSSYKGNKRYGNDDMKACRYDVSDRQH